MTAEKVNCKRRVRKNIESGVAYIHSTFDNTIVMITDTHGNTLTWSPTGSLGFRESKKLTPSAAQTTAEVTTKVAVGHGLKTVDVTVKGPGSGRGAAIRSLQATGLEVTAIRDMTPAPRNGCHPPKRRRI